MHELSIAHSILTIAEKAVPADTPGMISAVNLQIGELSGIEIEALEFAFQAVKADTRLEAAELQIEKVPGEATCQACGTVFHLPAFGDPCPTCHSYSLRITGGREMKVLSITVEDPA